MDLCPKPEYISINDSPGKKKRFKKKKGDATAKDMLPYIRNHEDLPTDRPFLKRYQIVFRNTAFSETFNVF